LLKIFAWISLGIAFACALFIAADETRRPQKMGIMNVVWPISGLYFSVFAVWAYLRRGLKKTRRAMQEQQHGGGGHGGSPKEQDALDRKEPTASQVTVGTSHCGAGCAIADVFCEFLIAAAGITLLGLVLWAEYAIDFAAA
jgi:hypothetical protein